MANIIFSGLVLFVFCLSLHVFVWRLKRPSSTHRALFLIFLGMPVLMAVVSSVVFSFSADGLRVLAAVMLLHLSLGAAYIMSYPAVEALSPSLAITLMLKGAGASGLGREDLLGIFSDTVVLGPRLADLERAGMITSSDGSISITGRGRALVRPFILLRRILGLSEGAG